MSRYDLNAFVKDQLLSDSAWDKRIRQQLPSPDNALAGGTSAPATEQGEANSPALIATLRDAIEKGIEADTAEVDAIADNPESPDFSNTIAALACSGGALERATSVLYNLLESSSSDELDAFANELSPVLTDHSNQQLHNPRLFARVKAVKAAADAAPESLTTEEHMLLEKTYEGFVRSGANLSEDDKETFRALSRKLSAATLEFSQRLVRATHAYTLHLTDESDVKGLTDQQLEAAAQEARKRKLEGWVITLQAPSFVPFMTHACSRKRREELYRAYHTRCTQDGPNDNRQLVVEIVNTRQAIARLLGYPNYAVYTLKRRMAATPDRVNAMLNDLERDYLPVARQELAEVEREARKCEGEDFKLQAWDFAYYSNKLKRRLYNYDPEELRPYFELSAVISGVFGLATRLYGITFEAAEDLPVYHPEVRAYRVFDQDHSYLATLYADFFPREHKQGGAWMSGLRDESSAIPVREAVTTANSLRPAVTINMNFTKPVASRPSLLTLDEVTTFLHEFGHALHGMFAMTHFASISGTSVYWDFVELPSQFMENYAFESDFLHTFAKHYQTGEPLPEALLASVIASRRFHAAYACIRQVSFGLLDMAYYSRSTPLPERTDLSAFEREVWRPITLLPPVKEACMSVVSFSHIMSGGYAAGYYSYKWAEVLDADAFAAFREHGIFNRATAQSFRDNILSRGGTDDPERLYERFRGKAPSIDALLARDGIAKG